MPLWDDAGIHHGHREGTYSPGHTRETPHITEARGPNKTQRTEAKLGDPRTTAPPAEGAWQEQPHGPQGTQAGCPTGHQRSPQQAVSLAPPAAKAALSAPRRKAGQQSLAPHPHPAASPPRPGPGQGRLSSTPSRVSTSQRPCQASSPTLGSPAPHLHPAAFCLRLPNGFYFHVVQVSSTLPLWFMPPVWS